MLIESLLKVIKLAQELNEIQLYRNDLIIF